MSSQYAQENVEAEGSLSGHFVVASSGIQASSRENVVAFKRGRDRAGLHGGWGDEAGGREARFELG